MRFISLNLSLFRWLYCFCFCCCCCFTLLNLCSSLNENVTIEPTNCLIWGPGLKANFKMPVRYFYVQLVDKNFNYVNYSRDDYLSVEILQINSNRPATVHIQILNRHNGSYIVRYRLYQNHENLRINVKNNQNKHLAGSPFYLNGQVETDDCECPEEDLSKWYETMGCNQTYTQLEIDLKKFINIHLDMNKLGKKIINTFNQRYSQSICNYVILNNKVYRKCYGEHIGFKMFSDAAFLSLTRKVKLPDVEFFMNLGDWPLNEKKQNLFLPIVSWCGSTKTNDVILPTYELTEATIEMMGSLDIFSVQGNTGPKWHEKLNKSFWRGRDSRKERLDLVLMSRKNPNLIDAALTNMFFFTEPEQIKLYGPLAPRTPFYDFFKYKYQLNIDGTVAAYRLPYLLVSDSVVFKQESLYYEHFYADLQPFVHYVPIKSDLSDLVEKVKWAIDNDEMVKKISLNAQQYAREYLQPHHIICYHVKFFEAFSKLLKSKVKVRKEMEFVESPTNAKKQSIKSMCNCKGYENNDKSNNLNENIKAEL